MLSRIRLTEAQGLLKLGLADGAYYLAGYSVECALEACIAKATRRGEFPDKKRVELSHTHSLLQLCRVAGLEELFAARAKKDSVFRDNWILAQSWSENSRYRRHDEESASALIEAISNRSHGVVSWIKNLW